MEDLRWTSTSLVCTCCCCCCLTRFPSLPALKIFSPKLIFLNLLLKSSFLDESNLDDILTDNGLAVREGLDILNMQKYYLLQEQILKILFSFTSQQADLELLYAVLPALKWCAASLISFKQKAFVWSHRQFTKPVEWQMCVRIELMTVLQWWILKVVVKNRCSVMDCKKLLACRLDTEQHYSGTRMPHLHR